MLSLFFLQTFWSRGIGTAIALESPVLAIVSFCLLQIEGVILRPLTLSVSCWCMVIMMNLWCRYNAANSNSFVTVWSNAVVSSSGLFRSAEPLVIIWMHVLQNERLALNRLNWYSLWWHITLQPPHSPTYHLPTIEFADLASRIICSMVDCLNGINKLLITRYKKRLKKRRKTRVLISDAETQTASLSRA